MIDGNRMLKWTKEYDIDLVVEQINALDRYAAFLVEYNKKVNLTAIIEPQEIEIKHFLDSLLLAAQPEVKGKIADIGSGAGFPGVILKLYDKKNNVTLFEPTGKKVIFLTELVALLGIEITIEKERAEEAARKQWREQFDFVTARAVASLPVLCEYCLPFVKKGGHFIAMKGNDLGELEAAQKAIIQLGGKLRDVRDYVLPDGAPRKLIVIEKNELTPEKYPRHGAVISKRPL